MNNNDDFRSQQLESEASFVYYKDKRPEKRRKKHLNDYDDVVSVWMWILVFIIYYAIASIPVAGPIILFFVLLFMSFLDTINLNLRNLSRAIIILEVILIILIFFFARHLLPF